MSASALRPSQSPTYHSWERMVSRCCNENDPSFADYGGRGIKVCERWRSFAVFIVDMGTRPSPDHSLDRIDNEGNYEPGNCRWATRSQQQRNKRNTHLLTFDGVTMPLIEWAERAGMKRTALLERIRRGWGVERALHQPPKAWSRR